MPVYSTKKIFQVAAFDLFYGSVIARAIRALVGLILALLLLIPINSGSPKPPYFALSATLLFIMFEAFYRFKLSHLRPNKRVSESGEWADKIDLGLAKLMLQTPHWDSVSWWFARLAKKPTTWAILTRADFSHPKLEKLVGQTLKETINLEALMSKAAEVAKEESKTYIDETDILLTLFEINEELKKALFDKHLKDSDLTHIAYWVRASAPAHFWERPIETAGTGIAELWSGGWTAVTEQFTFDISQALLKGQVDGTLIGREKEITQIEAVLSRTGKRNVILLGEAGVGRASLVYGLALKSLAGTLPKDLKYKRFLELDLNALVANASGGELEARVKAILEELSHAGNVVLFIPEIDEIVNQNLDLSSLLTRELGRGSLEVIGSTSRAAYHEFIEQKPAFAETFETIDIDEPSPDQTLRILEGRVGELESQHKVVIAFRSLTSAVDLANQYLVDRVFPAKAIDLLDEVAAAVSLGKKAVVEPEDVERILSQKTKIPVATASGNEADKLINLEKILHQRVVAQDEALNAVAEAVRRARSLSRDTTRPIGVFLFLGPTGVGKTETAKALAQVYFGSETSIVRIDMSEFANESALNRLIGPPPGVAGYESGGQLTEAVRAHPFSLVLLDEIEKANPKIQEAFLAIFDEGRINDSSGRLVSFTNTIIIATSNAGAEFIREAVQASQPIEKLKAELLEKLQREGNFKPEFLNRFDDVVVFKPLSSEQVRAIVTLELAKLERRLSKQDLKINLTDSAVDYLAKKGYDTTYGARSLRRLMQDEVESLISHSLLEGKITRGATATVDCVNNQLVNIQPSVS